MNDLKFACRLLLKNPGFTAVAVLTLAIGIGAAITIFAFVNVYLLRPLPYLDADRLTIPRPVNDSFGPMSTAYTPFPDWQERNTAFESIGCVR